MSKPKKNKRQNWQQRSPRTSNQLQQGGGARSQGEGRAGGNYQLRSPAIEGPGFINPYNFVRWGAPSPRNIDPLAIGQAITHEKFSGLSGKLTCEIEVLTPLAIPDSEHAYPDPQVPHTKEDEAHLRKPFLRLNPRLREKEKQANLGCDQTAWIPGSSLKGMLRSLAEAVTGSCATVLTEELAVFRDNRNVAVVRRLGRLKDKGGRWQVLDTDTGANRVYIWNKRAGRANQKDGIYQRWRKRLFPDPERTKPGPTSISECYEDHGQQYPWYDLLRGTFGDTERRDFNRDGEPYRDGKRVIRPLPKEPVRREGQPVVIRWPLAEKKTSPVYDVAEGIVDQYREMVEEADGFLRFHQERVSLRQWQRDYLEPRDEEIYWYRREGNTVTQVGRNYRFKWAYDPRKAVPKEFHPCKEVDKLCPICTLYGMAAEEKIEEREVNALAGRLTIGPAAVKPGTTAEFEWIECVKILGEPKHSCRSFYLEPSHAEDWNVGKDEFIIWDKDKRGYRPTAARGRNFYWHQKKLWEQGGKKFEYFQKLPSDDPDTQGQRVKTQHNQSFEVAMPGSKFQFEITFENLHAWELGLLLWTLELPDVPNGAHHLGLGKPLGLGSVKVTITGVTLIDRKQRYEDSFALGIDPNAVFNPKTYLEAFRKQVVGWNGNRDFNSLEQVLDLRAILSLDQPAISGSEVPIQYPPGKIERKTVPNMNHRELHYTWFGVTGFKWHQRLLTIEEIVQQRKRQQRD